MEEFIWLIDQVCTNIVIAAHVWRISNEESIISILIFPDNSKN